MRKLIGTWSKMACNMCHENVTLCVFEWGGAGRRGNNTENKLRITTNDRSGFKSSVTLLDFYFSRTIVFWAINLQVTSNKIVNLRKLIAKIMWKINLNFSLTPIQYFALHSSLIHQSWTVLKLRERSCSICGTYGLSHQSTDYTVQKGDCILHHLKLWLYFGEEITGRRKKKTQGDEWKRRSCVR